MQPMITIPVASPGVYSIPTEATTSRYDRYPQKASIRIGVLQMIVGFICLIFAFTSILLEYFSFGAIVLGLFAILFIVTGGIGCAAGKTKSKCQVVGYLVLCITSANFAAVLLSVGILLALIESNYDVPCNPAKCPYRHRHAVAYQICRPIASFVEGILGILGAVICCKAGACACCCSTPETGYVVARYQPNNVVLLQPCAQGLQSTYPGPTAERFCQQVPMVNLNPASSSSFDQRGITQDGPRTQNAVNFTIETAALLNEDIRQNYGVKQPTAPPPPYSP